MSEMSAVVAYVRPEKIEDIKKELADIGAGSLTVTNVSGRGSETADTKQWRGEEYTVDLHRRVKIECVVADVPAQDVVDAIKDAAHTGLPGDGKIFILPVESAMQVRSKKRNADAI